MSRPKRPVPTPKHVNAVAKMKRDAQIRRPGTRKPKPRVRVGTPAAEKLGIK